MKGAKMWGPAALALVLAFLPVGIQGAGQPGTQGTGPRASGPGGHIAYVSDDGNLYLALPDGTGQRALTSDGKTAPYARPTWSPTGGAILAVRFATSLYAAGSSTPAGLWLVSTAGGARQLTANVPRGFAWAPDGHIVVYEEGFPPDQTVLVQLDTRSGQKHTVNCDGAFVLAGVAAPGNRAIGVHGSQIEAVSLDDGTSQALTRYGKEGVWQNVAQVTRAGRTVLYAEAPGTHVVMLDLRSGRGTTVRVSDAVIGVAPSPDLRWLAYSIVGPGHVPQSTLVRINKGAASLRSDSYVTPQAFAPDSSALAFTSQLDGSPAVFVASTACPARCARRIGTGHDPAWGP